MTPLKLYTLRTTTGAMDQQVATSAAQARELTPLTDAVVTRWRRFGRTVRVQAL